VSGQRRPVSPYRVNITFVSKIASSELPAQLRELKRIRHGKRHHRCGSSRKSESWFGLGGRRSKRTTCRTTCAATAGHPGSGSIM